MNMIQVKARYIKKKYEKTISEWAGLNQNALIGDNQFSSTTNMSTKNFPLISPRPPRTDAVTLAGTGWALFAANQKVCYVDGTSFKYDGTTKGTVTASSKSMVDFNSRIGIFPDAKKYDYISDTFSNMLGKLNLLKYGFDDNGDVDYTTGSTKMRNKILIGVTPSTSYTLVNDKGYTDATVYYFDVNGLLVAYAPVNFSAFTTPSNVYYMNVSITGTDLTCAVSITGAVYPTKTAIPTISYACTWNNRVWGVHGDNIYACRQGNIDDWTTINADSVATDAWTVDTGSGGDFTGIASYNNYVYAFKKTGIWKIFGHKASNFECINITDIGCISSKSIVEVNEALFFLGSKGIYRYTGGQPELISYDLNATYTSGVAGGDGRRYYISLYNGSTYDLFVYDTWTNVWVQEDDSNITEFAYQYPAATPNGYLTVLKSDNHIYLYDVGSETVTMTVITKEWTENSFNKKAVTELNIRADLETSTTLTVSTRIDNGSWVIVKNAYATADHNSFRIPIAVNRADHFQVKFVMVGEGKIYGLERVMTIGGRIGSPSIPES